MVVFLRKINGSGVLFRPKREMRFFLRKFSTNAEIHFFTERCVLGGILVFSRKICYFGTHCANPTKTNRFLGVFGSISTISAICNEVYTSGRRNHFFRKTVFCEKEHFALILWFWGQRGRLGDVFGYGFLNDPLHRDSLYRDPPYRDSLYSDSLYRGFPI